ncbi:MAG: hypothetical protein IPG22_23280 [Acidobacteria bacterium]|nr:hypothetical protein [Acidobacteriota bacterium]
MREIEAEINKRARRCRTVPPDIPINNFRGIELRNFFWPRSPVSHSIIAEYQSDLLYRGQSLRRRVSAARCC